VNSFFIILHIEVHVVQAGGYEEYAVD